MRYAEGNLSTAVACLKVLSLRPKRCITTVPLRKHAMLVQPEMKSYFFFSKINTCGITTPHFTPKQHQSCNRNVKVASENNTSSSPPSPPFCGLYVTRNRSINSQHPLPDEKKTIASPLVWQLTWRQSHCGHISNTRASEEFAEQMPLELPSDRR